MQQYINPIEKDELTGIAELINDLEYLSGDILDNYFYSYNPTENKEDLCAVGYDFARNRAYMDLIFRSICQISKELKQLGISF